MKLKEIKKLLENMTKEQLNQDLVIVACDRTLSGVGVAKKAKCNIYYDGNDDPSELKTLSELKEMYDADEITGMEIIVKRGELFIELP